VRVESNPARDTLRGKRASGTGRTGVRDNAVVLIRPRADHDLTACAALVREVHAADRYPRYLPADLGNFLAPPAPYGFWVADVSTDIAGHVALVARSMPSVMAVASAALGRPEARLAVVARLFVSPRTRTRGTGRSLLDAATAEAAARGLHPVLDVDTELSTAIALYESAGWTRAGVVTVRFGDGDRVLNEYVYVGPDPGCR
jgi:GNAT superfamily N-acetyltransferase